MTTIFSGATAGETKNTVDAQNVSTMPDEGLKLNFRQIYSSVDIFENICARRVIKKNFCVFQPQSINVSYDNFAPVCKN